MFNADKLAKDAMQKLQKTDKLGGTTGEVAKGILQGVKKAEELAGGKAPEKLIAALRGLLEEAKKLAASSGNKNEALNACIQKAQALLDGGDISTEAVTKLTAELGALIKGAGDAGQQASTKSNAAPVKAGTSAQPAAAKAPEAKAPEAPKGKAVQFSDVKEGAYYYDAVQWAVEKGVASGTTETTFGPDQTCTRAQTIALLWRAAGSPAPKSRNNPFTDVKEGAYYYDAVLWAAERGIATGTAFNPDTAVTRGQVATFLYRNAGSPAAKAANTFADVPSDSYCYQAVTWVAAQGITSGTKENTFSPDDACTRGQIVTFLYRAMK